MPEDKRYKVEGFWDCPYCDRTGIRGRFKYCPGCGHGRDASVKFYTKSISEEDAITQEEFQRETAEADHNSRSESVLHSEADIQASSQPSLYNRKEGEGTGAAGDDHDASDWYCDYCDSYNPQNANFCRNCGAAREQSSGKTYEQTMGKVARTYDEHGNLVSERDLSTRRKREPEPKPEPTKKGLPLIAVLAMVVAGIAILGLLGSMLFGPKTKEITIDGFSWEQAIQIEQLQTVQESGWTVPEGARVTNQALEIRSYNHVLDHYETEEYEVTERVIDHYETYTTEVDNGDGTFDVEKHEEPVYTTETRIETREVPIYRDDPVYDTKYYYDIERYVHNRDVSTSGSDHSPTWGNVELSPATGDYGTGQEREGARSGTYRVTDSEGTTYTADLVFWQTLEQGQTLKVVVDNNHITPAE